MKFLLVYVPAALFFFFAATYLIDLPGIFMDAVNPDYMVVQILHPDATNLPNWSLPGMMVMGRFPIVATIYHGALSLYLSLPIYWLLGTGLEAIRFSNMVFGLLVLAGGAAFLRAWNIRSWIVAIALCALALDPAFLFAWRTQFYITLLPLAPLLASVALIQSKRDAASPWAMGLAGLLAGIACYGYFIFCFLVPIAFLHAWIVLRRSNQIRIIWWLAGLTLGMAPYALALAIIRRTTGSGFIPHLQSHISGLNLGQSQLDLLHRLFLFCDYVRQSVLGVGPEAMMTSTFPSIAPTFRLVFLLGLPICGIGLWAISKVRPPGLLVLAGFVLGLLCLTLAFGDRLWLHHFAVLVPILYLALASVWEAIARLVSNYAIGRIAAMSGGALLFGLLLAANLTDTKEVFSALRRTGGVGLYSDAIVKFAMDSLNVKDPSFYFFPDWGVFMSFVMLTHGSLPYNIDFDEKTARAVLCDGKDVVVVLVMGKNLERLRTWTETLRWIEPIQSIYSQRDGTNVLTVARWKTAARPAGACSH